MSSLFVREIPTLFTKMETKIIRHTQTRANQFDAGTLTEALQTEAELNAQSQRQKVIIIRQRDSYVHHKTRNKNRQSDTIYSEPI